MPIVLWFSRLQPGVQAEQYAEFVRRVDYPASKRVPSILRYQSIRVVGPAMGDEQLPYQFVDMAQISDVQAYRKDLQEHPAVQEVHWQFERYVQSIGNFWALPIEDKDASGTPPAGEGPTPTVIWYSKLQPGVARGVYERWVQEVDYPGAKQVPSLLSYRVYRVQGPCVGPQAGFDYDYVEVARVSDMQDYLRDLETHPAAQEIIAQIGRYVRSVGSAWGYPVAE